VITDNGQPGLGGGAKGQGLKAQGTMYPEDVDGSRRGGRGGVRGLTARLAGNERKRKIVNGLLVDFYCNIDISVPHRETEQFIGCYSMGRRGAIHRAPDKSFGRSWKYRREGEPATNIKSSQVRGTFCLIELI